MTGILWVLNGLLKPKERALEMGNRRFVEATSLANHRCNLVRRTTGIEHEKKREISNRCLYNTRCCLQLWKRVTSSPPTKGKRTTTTVTPARSANCWRFRPLLERIDRSRSLTGCPRTKESAGHRDRERVPAMRRRAHAPLYSAPNFQPDAATAKDDDPCGDCSHHNHTQSRPETN